MKEELVKEEKKKVNEMDTVEKNKVDLQEEKKENKKEEKTKESKKDNQKEETNNKKENKKEKFKKAKDKPKKIKKEMDKMDNKKSKKKYIVLGAIIGILLIVGLVISTIFALANVNNDKIISGVSISGIEVSGLTKEEAKAKIELIYNEKKETEIDLKYQDYETTLSPTLMEVNYKIDEAVENAYLTGRKSNIFLSNYDILFTLIGKKNIPVTLELNEEVTRQTIEGMNVNLPGVVIESSYSIEDDELIITKGKAGVMIDTENLLNKVKENLTDINIKENLIEIPVINKEPEAIDIDKIHEEVYKEAQDAYYTKDPFAVYPEVEGVDFDVEAAKALLQEDKEEYVIKLIITKPNKTLDEIGPEAFPDQLSTFTTRYDVSDVDRTTNLQIACQKINGTVLLAGETFSYNKTLGARTVAAGYKNAKIYEAGQVVDGLGGGICQISSTLYNSVLKANLEIVERRNHQFVTSYVEAGLDATVVYGVTDFQFKNTRQYPIRIVASAKNGIATVSIYGIKEEQEYTFKFSTKTVASIPYNTQYIEDPNLPVGTEKVKQKGANGLKTETYITKMLNGKVVSTKLLSKDTYNAMTRIIIKGTKPVETQNQPTENTQVPETSTDNNQTETTEPENPETEEQQSEQTVTE